MPRTTFKYPFEARIHAAVIAATGDPAAHVLLRFEPGTPGALVREGEAAAGERRQHGASGQPFLYYDGLDALEYAFVQRRGVSLALMETWLGRAFVATDFTPHGDKSGADDLRLRAFPADWSVKL